MTWKPKPDRWDWRAFLTADEKRFIEQSDRAAAVIERAKDRYEKRFGRQRQLIANRAIQRAKYDART